MIYVKKLAGNSCRVPGFAQVYVSLNALYWLGCVFDVCFCDVFCIETVHRSVTFIASSLKYIPENIWILVSFFFFFFEELKFAESKKIL